MGKVARYGALAAIGAGLGSMAKRHNDRADAEQVQKAQTQRDQRLHEFRIAEVGARSTANATENDRVYKRNRADKVADQAATAKKGAAELTETYRREDEVGQIKHGRAVELKQMSQEGMDPMDLSMIQDDARMLAEQEASDKSGYFSSDDSDFGMSEADWVVQRSAELVDEQMRLLRGGQVRPGQVSGEDNSAQQYQQPNARAVAALREQGQDPAMVQAFERKFGPGSAQRVLAQ